MRNRQYIRRSAQKNARWLSRSKEKRQLSTRYTLLTHSFCKHAAHKHHFITISSFIRVRRRTVRDFRRNFLKLLSCAGTSEICRLSFLTPEQQCHANVIPSRRPHYSLLIPPTSVNYLSEIFNVTWNCVRCRICAVKFVNLFGRRQHQAVWRRSKTDCVFGIRQKTGQTPRRTRQQVALLCFVAVSSYSFNSVISRPESFIIVT